MLRLGDSLGFVGGPKAEEAPAEPILAEVLSTIQKVPIGNVFSCK